MLNRLLFAFALAALLVVGAPQAALAQPTEPMIELPGHVPPGISSLEPSVPAPPDQTLSLEMMFKLRNEAELDQLLADQQNPSSPLYQHPLTHEEVLSRFWPTHTEAQAVADWLAGHGFQVVSVDREFIRFSGTVSQCENAFRVKIVTASDRQRYGNLSDPMVPQRFASVVAGILGLNNLTGSGPSLAPKSRPSSPQSWSPRPRKGTLRLAQSDAGVAFVGGNNPVGFGVADMRTFYSETPLINSGIDGGKVGTVTTNCPGHLIGLAVNDRLFTSCSLTLAVTQEWIPRRTYLLPPCGCC